MNRVAAVLFAIARVALAASFPANGEVLFRDCEFKAAAHVFQQALTNEPADARLHFWLGKSYARMAEVSGPLSARTNSRNAQAHLEAAIRLDPANREYLMELFELYVDSPEYFDGGLRRAAALLERLGPDDGGPGSPSRIVAQARKQYSGSEWALRKCILRASGAVSYLVPQKSSGR